MVRIGAVDEFEDTGTGVENGEETPPSPGFGSDSPQGGECKKPKNRSQKKLIALLSVIAVVLLIISIVFIVLFALEKKHSSELENEKTTTETPTGDPKCDLKKCTRSFKQPPLVVMSMDGFRASYLGRNITPAIERLIDCGVHSKFMMPSFPSKTFPNHYTIVTGLYPAWSGIVGNHFYDPQRNATFGQSSHEPGWYLGEPIWNTVQKYGLKSAVYFWPGSEAPANGMQPNIWMKYNESVSFYTRVDKVIEWLNLPDDQRPSLIQLYVSQPDSAGHKGGPDSEVVNEALIQVNNVTEYFIKRLIDEGLMGCINFVLVSDHGMQALNSSRAVVMEKLLPQPFTQDIFTGSMAHISMRNNDTTVEKMIEPMRCNKGDNYITFKTKNVPARYHYSGNDRIGQVVIICRPGAFAYKTEADAITGADRHGNHGFNNRLVSMRAIFIGIGPDLAEKKEIESFQNIQLYNLFAKLLRIPPAPNNGTEGHLHSALRIPPKDVPEIQSTLTTTQCVTNLKMENCSASCSSLENLYASCATPQKPTVEVTITDGEECVVPLCDAVVHYNNKLLMTQLVETLVTPQTWSNNSTANGCLSYVEGLSPHNQCGTNTTATVSLFLGQVGYNTMTTAFMTALPTFSNGSWPYLVNKIDGYVKQFGNMMMYSGPVYDANGDGLRDPDDVIRRSSPSHAFVILMRCASCSMITPNLCHDVIFLPFILPVIDGNFNCLDAETYLYQNTARVMDVEMMTGLQFFTNRTMWTPIEAILLRTKVTTAMW